MSSATVALAALNQPQLMNITVASGKPGGSKIQLTKTQDVLDIIIPPTGFVPSMVFTGLFAISWNSFIFFWTISAVFIPFPSNIFFALFSLPFWAAGFHILSLLLFPLFKRTRLHFTQWEVDFIKEIFGFQLSHISSSRENITKLVYVPRYLTKDSEGNRTQVPAQLDIWVGVQKYQISVDYAGLNGGVVKSEAELEWLAHELSDWLGLPITRE